MAKILVVDDDPSVLQSIGMLLKTEGHAVASCDNAAAALTSIQDDRPNLLITDIRMAPMDGMELLQQVHDSWPDLPMMVISAYGSERTVEQSMELGCLAYIRKPFKIQDVMDAIRQALD